MAGRRVACDSCRRHSVDDENVDNEKKKRLKEEQKLVESLIRKNEKSVFVEKFDKTKTIRDKWNIFIEQGCCRDTASGDCDTVILVNFNLNDFNNHIASIHTSVGADSNNVCLNNSFNSHLSFREFSFEGFWASINKI